MVIIVLGISNGRFLFQTSLMNLVRYEKKAEKSMKFHFLPSLLGLVMTLTGYVLALDIFRGRKSLWFSVGFYQTGLLTAMLILLGTVFFISSFLPCVMKCSKKNKRAFYTQTRIITTPVFVYRVRSNASTLIMLTLLSATTLTVASVMALTLYYPIACVSRMAPSELEFRVANEHQTDAAKCLVNQYAPNGAVTFTQTDIYKITSSSDSLPMEYSVGTAKGDAQNETILREAGFECISYIGLLASARFVFMALSPLIGYASVRFLFLFLFQDSGYKFRKSTNAILLIACAVAVASIGLPNQVYAFLYGMQFLVNWLCLTWDTI